MAEPLPDPVHACVRCLAPLAAGDLACSRCNALVHAQQLEEWANAAKACEQRGENFTARDFWLKALNLLPAQASQAEWIRGNVRRLSALIPPPPSKDVSNGWIRKLGPLAPVAVVLAKGKFLLSLLKLKFLLSLGVFVAFYWGIYGAWFGIGFAVLILVHEMGHFIEIRRRGLPAEMPVFLPGLGAYVRWTALGVTAQTRACVSLAGPMAGLIGSVVCVLLWMNTGASIWIGLASVSAMLNVLNLIPVWVLDGAQAVLALDRTDRIVLVVAAVVFAALYSQPLFLLVAAGAAYRLFTKDLPGRSNHGVAVYYVLLMAGLGLIMAQAPMPAPVT